MRLVELRGNTILGEFEEFLYLCIDPAICLNLPTTQLHTKTVYLLDDVTLDNSIIQLWIIFSIIF